MRVLHVSTPVSWRGGEHQVALLVDGLDKLDVQNAVLCPGEGELAKRLRAAHHQVVPFHSKGVMGSMLARAIALNCRPGSFDILHAHDAHAHTAAVIAAAFLGNRIPVVVSRRVDFPVGGSLLSRWKYNHPCVRKIICVSEAIRKIMSPALKNTSVLEVVPDGILLDAYPKEIRSSSIRSELGIPEHAPLVGNMSALADHKDYPTFIRVAAEVLKENPDVHFIIAGQGEEEQHIRKTIHALNVGHNVHLLGFRKDVPALIKALDVFLMTSKTEGMGSVILEAFAIGTPVVATAAGGIPELVSDGETGLLLPVADVQGLKKAVIRLLKDTHLRERLLQGAQERVRSFSFLKTARATLNVYQQVV